MTSVLLAAAIAVLATAVGSADTPDTAQSRAAGRSDPDGSPAARLAQRVTIHRDAYGVPHVDGADDSATIFGFAYVQAEDNFWQVEDNFILSLGRYSEAHGPTGLNSDLLNRAFEIVPFAKAQVPRLSAPARAACEAFAAGLNHYLDTHADAHPRLIRRFEPWHLVALGRHMTLEMCFRFTRLSNSYLPRSHDVVWTQSGSNGWAIGPRRTATGRAMLLANPHLPWFGYGQLYEAHLKSGEGWSFTGATTLGNPVLSLGHNEHLGWTLTTNEPDIADVWRLTFDDPAQPLNYRSADGYRTAVEWHETLVVKLFGKPTTRTVTLRKTHLGPIVAREDRQHFLAANIAKLYDSSPLSQSLQMMRARDLQQFKSALAMQQFALMNVVYADRAGNIMYLYNGQIPRRDARFDWRRPVDGGDPRTQWREIHTLDELPQMLNPPSAYVQNCNSSPFTTCDEGNPPRERFPGYMIEDRDDDKRRAKISRQLLRGAYGLTFEQLQALAFDTTIWWAQEELPKYARRFEELQASDPALAARVEPYLKHLLAWDCRVTDESTQATLCEAWYERLYGLQYPAETLLGKYQREPKLELAALADAAEALAALYGDWRVPWGQVFRVQRAENVVDILSLPFDDRRPSLPCRGVPGPLGSVFTVYYAPSVRIPFLLSLKNRYGLIGATYVGVYEFGDRVRGATCLNFGQSGDPASPHYFDQAQLLSAGKLKPELFYWDDVLAGAVESYQPGKRSAKRPPPYNLRRPSSEAGRAD